VLPSNEREEHAAECALCNDAITNNIKG